MTRVDDTAPAFAPDAQSLPWYRRAIAQGAGYFLPNVVFLLIPLYDVATTHSPGRVAAAVAASLAVAVFFVGSSLVAHWQPQRRWWWLGGLAAAILGVAAAGGAPTRVAYLLPYACAAAVVLLPWRQAWPVVVVAVTGGVFLGLATSDLLAVIMSFMAGTIGLSIGLALVNEQTKLALAREEDRTAALAVVAERERIGRDLHDILGHSLTTIAVKADLAGRLVSRDPDAAQAEIRELAEVARHALADVRATASGMREVRLAGEIASARSVLGAAGIECSIDGTIPSLGEAASELFGYAVRESVTNVIRHAGASRCTITATETSITVTDDGRGIRGEARGSGLSGLARRADEAGGRLTIESSPAGTRVEVTLDPGEETP